MKFSALVQSELETINTTQIADWLTKKSQTEREYKRLSEDFKAIVIMQEAGFYEQADTRFSQWKNKGIPAELQRYRLAIAGKAGGKRLVKKRFAVLPAAVQNHPQLKPWKKQLQSNPWMLGGLLVAGLAVLGLFQLDFSQPEEVPVVTNQENVEQKLASLEKEVEQLKEKNEQLTEQAPAKSKETAKPKDTMKPKATTDAAKTLSPEETLKQAIAATQKKDYKSANRLLTGKVLADKTTKGMARFYKLIAAGKLGETKQTDYVAYREDFPDSGYMSDVLWMQAVYEQKNKVGNYKATLEELAKQPDNEWSYAAQAILDGKSTLGEE
ncbi:hypothetical protein [Exiguobacterium oxidotolerans]|uniref:Uncharacterized protein n=1 Tax=Exiguobacterium oxidotolerans TaxID=223958 RepID=A0A653I924_9BACL|nr:hypothetical protein [Exiguobacterium oxidotolerans]VWX35542.1 conserved hypothetical protein [Exiguobacterium oxidotolerans]